MSLDNSKILLQKDLNDIQGPQWLRTVPSIGENGCILTILLSAKGCSFHRCFYIDYPQCVSVPFVLRWRLEGYIARSEGGMYRANINLLRLSEVAGDLSKVRDIADTV